MTPTSKNETPTGLVPVTDAQQRFPALLPDVAREMAVAAAENMNGAGVTILDLPKVSVPAGGGTTWQREDFVTGETIKGDELRGIIVGVVPQRAYYSKSFDETGGGSPPDCSSMDGVTGRGSPGGNCGSCPLAVFGSAKNGRAQACTQMTRVALLEEGATFPLIVNVPPSSSKALKNYNLGLSTRSIPRSKMVTSLTLQGTKNADGIPMAVIRFQAAGMLSQEDWLAVKDYEAAIQPFLSSIKPEDGIYEAQAADGYAPAPHSPEAEDQAPE